MNIDELFKKYATDFGSARYIDRHKFTEAIAELLADDSLPAEPLVMPKIADNFSNKPIGAQDQNKEEVFEGDEIALIECGSQYIITWDSHSCGYYLRSIDEGEDDNPNSLFNNEFIITKKNEFARQSNFSA